MNYLVWVASRGGPILGIPAADTRPHILIRQAWLAALDSVHARAAKVEHQIEHANMVNDHVRKAIADGFSKEPPALDDVKSPPAETFGDDEMLVLDSGSFIPGTIIAITEVASS